ncbi:MAG: chromate transporter [Acidobacteria bacterium]|nr:chromate transporter [Acidobacteriota bacterium]
MLGAFTALSLRIGNLTFGGGDPTMLALRRKPVERCAWISDERFTLIWSFARVTPGTNVVACFARAGWTLAGGRGAVAGVLASCVPAAVFRYWLAVAERSWQSSAWLQAVLRGVMPAVAGMMLAGAVGLLKPAWRAGRLPGAVLMAVAAAGLSLAGAPPVAVLAGAAWVGWWRTPR